MAMAVPVRCAVRADDVAQLLYASAPGFYDRYAGDERRALGLLRGVWPRRGHVAGFDVCRLAESGGSVVGVLAGYPVEEDELRAGRFLTLTVARMAPWRWPRVARHVRAAARVAPAPPPGSWYVDALAVAGPSRRTGVARALLADAGERARARGCRALALDTALGNAPARRLYEDCGFVATGERRTDPRTAAALGAAGFVAYVLEL